MTRGCTALHWIRGHVLHSRGEGTEAPDLPRARREHVEGPSRRGSGQSWGAAWPEPRFFPASIRFSGHWNEVPQTRRLRVTEMCPLPVLGARRRGSRCRRATRPPGVQGRLLSCLFGSWLPPPPAFLGLWPHPSRLCRPLLTGPLPRLCLCPNLLLSKLDLAPHPPPRAQCDLFLT